MFALPRILVIDDSMTGRRLAQVALKDYPVQVAKNVQDGIALASETLPDLVLVKEILPDGDYRSFWQNLRNHTAQNTIALIILSERRQNEDCSDLRTSPDVVEVVQKPFTVEVIEHAAERAIRALEARNHTGGTNPNGTGATLSVSQKKGLARVLLGELAPRIGQLLEQHSGDRDQSPTALLANHVLTEDLIDRVVGRLPRETPSGTSIHDAATLRGKCGLFSPAEILRRLSANRQSGVFCWQRQLEQVICFLRQGEVVLAIGPAADARALLANDLTPDSPQADAIRGQSRAAVRLVLDATDGEFTWTEQGEVPAVAVSLGAACHLEAIELERLRETVEEENLISVFECVPDSVALAALYQLTPEETRTLSLVRSCAPARSLVPRSGLDEHVVARIVYRLVQSGLIRRPTMASERPVLVLDESPASVREPLTNFFARRNCAVGFGGTAADVWAEIQRQRPCLAILSIAAFASGDDLLQLALDVRAGPTLSDVMLIGVWSDDLPTDMKLWYEAGFDAVLAKPYSLRDLQALLEPASLPIFRTDNTHGPG